MKVIIGALLCLYLSSVVAAPPNPFLWQVSDDDNSIYLLGSMHKLKRSDYPVHPAVIAAFDDSEKIFFELSPDEMNDPALAEKMIRQGSLKGTETLQQLLEPGTWDLLVNYCVDNRIPIDKFLRFKPWLVSLFVSTAEAQKAGLNGEQGLDYYLMERAMAKNKTISAFETMAEQLAFFDTMSLEAQEQFLYDTLKETEDPGIFEKFHRLWRDGDAEGLWKMLSEDLIERSPAFYEDILVGRNRAWLPKIIDFLNRNTQDDALIVVGSAHLLGDDGLIKLLAARGFNVTRLPLSAGLTGSARN